MIKFLRTIEKQLKNGKFSQLLSEMIRNDRKAIINHLKKYQRKRRRIRLNKERRKEKEIEIKKIIKEYKKKLMIWLYYNKPTEKCRLASIILMNEMRKYYDEIQNEVTRPNEMRIILMMIFMCIEEILIESGDIIDEFREIYRKIYREKGLKMTGNYEIMILNEIIRMSDIYEIMSEIIN
jgi:hypothetical protein